MELIIAKEQILKGLAKIQSVVERRNTMPILSNVLLRADKNSLELSATDLEVGIRGFFPAEVKKDGVITLPARNLHDIIREMPEGDITLTVKENNWVEITSGKILFKLVGLPAEEYPKIQQDGDTKFGAIHNELLKEMIDKTFFAVSTDETRYNLNGIYFEIIEKDKQRFLRLVATDGHRLSLVDRELSKKDSFDLKGGIIIPRKGIQEIKKLAEEGSSLLNFAFTENSCVVKRDPYTIYIRLIEENFPNYKQVIPKENNLKVNVAKEDFLQTLRRVSLLSNEKFRGVLFSLSKDNLNLSITNPDMGEAKEDLRVDFSENKNLEVRFNPRYVLDILNAMVEDQLTIELGDDLGPGVFRGEAEEGCLNIVMPMRV